MYQYKQIPDSNVFRKRLRDSRKRAGLTLEELGNKIGVVGPTISKYESGTITRLQLEIINKLALALNVSPDYLLGYTDDPTLRQEDESVIKSFGHMGLVTSAEGADHVAALGTCLAAVATNDTVFHVVLELSRMTQEGQEMALKVIKGMNA